MHHYIRPSVLQLFSSSVVRSARYSGIAKAGSEGTLFNAQKSFYAKEVVVTEVPTGELKPKPLNDHRLGFGLKFSDYMVDVDWTIEDGWQKPKIQKNQPLIIDPAAKCLHYASQLFEGMKAYRGVDGKIRLFRPELNMARMNRTAIRCALPTFDAEELIQLISQAVRLDADWVPDAEGFSLYIRPTLIGTEDTLGVLKSKKAKLFVISGPAGSYFGSGFKAVNLLADARACRAWPGGVGAFKMGCNYAPTLLPGDEALKKDCQQVLWLSEKEEWVTEAGAMNIFVFWKNENGENELVTPSLNTGTILPGVTRQSILELANSWGQFKVSERDFTMKQLVAAIKEDRVYEMFGAGTAAVVSPVKNILYIEKQTGNEQMLPIPTMSSSHGVMKRACQEIIDIQYGRLDMPGWTREIV